MADSFSISDLHLFPLEKGGDRLRILRERDHLLRRFGLLEVVDLVPQDQSAFNLRAKADEIWAPLSGAAEVTLVDQRPGSPSRGERLQLSLDAADPQGLLIPFGVAHAFTTGAQARFLRLSTHSEEHPQDRQGSDAEVNGDLPSGAPR